MGMDNSKMKTSCSPHNWMLQTTLIGALWVGGRTGDLSSTMDYINRPKSVYFLIISMSTLCSTANFWCIRVCCKLLFWAALELCGYAKETKWIVFPTYFIASGIFPVKALTALSLSKQALRWIVITSLNSTFLSRRSTLEGGRDHLCFVDYHSIPQTLQGAWCVSSIIFVN